jgi:hypothetical protein
MMTRAALFAAAGLAALLTAGAASAQTISVGQTVSGTITTSDAVVVEDGSYYDCWVFRAPAGNYTVDYRSNDFDAFVGVGRGTDCGVPVEFFNDDGAESLDSHLEFATDGGAWFIKANTLEGGETGAYTLTLTAGGTPGGGDMADMGGEDMSFAAIDQLMAMEGADVHILNVVCSAVDTLDLISTMETMTEDQLMARIEAGERFTNAAYASGLALGFARDEVEGQVAEFGAAMLLDPEMAVDVPCARQECMGLVG